MKNRCRERKKNREGRNLFVSVTVFVCLSLLIAGLAVADVNAGSGEELKALRIAETEGDRQKVTRLGELFLKKYPQSESIPEVLFILAHAEDAFDRKRDYLGEIKKDYHNTVWAERAYLEMGKIYLLRGDNGWAAREFSSLSNNYGKSSFLDEAFLLTGIARLADGNYSQARLSFEKAMEASKNADIKTRAKIGIGDTYYLSGEFQRSLKFYTRLSQQRLKGEHKTKVMLNLALTHSALGEDDKAKIIFERLQKDYPSSLEAHTASKRLKDYDDDNNLQGDGGGAYLQVGVYSTLISATKYKSRLSGMGLEATILEGEVFKVLLGPFSDAIEAQIYSERLKNEKGIDSFVFER